CGETRIFFERDHKNHDGNEDRAKYGGIRGTHRDKRIQDGSNEREIQILCANCNSAKSYKGQEYKISGGRYKSKCPHAVCRESYQNLKMQCEKEGLSNDQLRSEVDNRLFALLLNDFLPLSKESRPMPAKSIEHAHSCLRCEII